MRNHQILSSLAGVVLFGLATFSASAARADASTCQIDSDCGKGWSCQVTGGTACASGPACPPGAPCEAPPPCANQVLKSCVPANCNSDADCADGMVCFSYPTPCPAVSCPAGAECFQPVCDPGPSQCTPKYNLPCAADADCGAGFTCAFGQECTGGTSSGSAGSAGGGAPPPPVPTICTTSTIGSCQLTPVSCMNNTDCQSGWSCINVAPGYGCAVAGSAPGASGGASGGAIPAGGSAGLAGSAGSGAYGGDISIECPPPPAPVMQCVPPSYSSGVGYGSGGASSGTTTTSGSAGTTATGSGGATAQAGAASTPTAPGANSGPGTAGSAGPVTSKSCAVAAPGAAGNGAFALLALGLVGFLRRRRGNASLEN